MGLNVHHNNIWPPVHLERRVVLYQYQCQQQYQYQYKYECQYRHQPHPSETTAYCSELLQFVTILAQGDIFCLPGSIFLAKCSRIVLKIPAAFFVFFVAPFYLSPFPTPTVAAASVLGLSEELSQ